ncbi:MAG: amylo-alpha-1,6-glucosidase [Candidatus Nitrosoglobus sp.]|jgi:glycogen debranching enzyme
MPQLNSPEDHEGKELIEQCYQHSIALLRRNAIPAGIMASTPTVRANKRHYIAVFGRDAAICALGLIASKQPDLITTAVNSLITLAKHQAPNGQIPKYVEPDTNETDFWYTGCIDATLWWLIALNYIDEHQPEIGLGAKFSTEKQRALNWLMCQEHQTFFLLQQNEASDWADIMPRSGFVLYTNALWFYVKKLYRLSHLEETRYYFNTLFFPFRHQVIKNRRAHLLAHYARTKCNFQQVYLSFMNFSFWGEEIDVFGNILALLFNLPQDSQWGREIQATLSGLHIDQPFPVRVVGAPIQQQSPLWRTYMERHQQNYPHQYHNGGIWPFVGGFWALLLARFNMLGEAKKTLLGMAISSQIDDWQFNEWFHGETGKPMGMPGQSWNAAMFIFVYHILYEELASKRKDGSGFSVDPVVD